MTDTRLRYNHRQIYTLVSSDKAKADAQYAAGLAHDALDDLAQAYHLGVDISIVCGALDTLFPPREIRHNLVARNLPVKLIEVPGTPHSSLATKQGLRLLRAALEINTNRILP